MSLYPANLQRQSQERGVNTHRSRAGSWFRSFDMEDYLTTQAPPEPLHRIGQLTVVGIITDVWTNYGQVWCRVAGKTITEGMLLQWIERNTVRPNLAPLSIEQCRNFAAAFFGQDAKTALKAA